MQNRRSPSPYSRQHKKKGREGLTASLLGHIYENMGVTSIITLDIHSREIENSFGKAHIENLHASYQIIRELSKLVDLTEKNQDLVVVSPDTGAVDLVAYSGMLFRYLLLGLRLLADHLLHT